MCKYGFIDIEKMAITILVGRWVTTGVEGINFALNMHGEHQRWLSQMIEDLISIKELLVSCSQPCQIESIIKSIVFKHLTFPCGKAFPAISTNLCHPFVKEKANKSTTIHLQ